MENDRIEIKVRQGRFKRPEQVIWKDGRRWKIKRVLHTAKSPDMSYKGTRYTVLMGDSERYIYRDRDSWYVLKEGKEKD
ncbi:MAG: hypothetical protein IKI74_03835 [Christensenellaceae bacterium]|jgi:hypothetical protein|nr:hypothetical protein [Christensenellaceae bacterium]